MKGLFTGSFDPITLGHVDIIKRASSLVDVLVVGVFNNEQKTYLCNLENRVNIVKLALDNIQNVSVVGSSGTVVDFCQNNGIEQIYRGFRNSIDYEYELEMAVYNNKNSGILTCLLPAKEEFSCMSSTKARECYESGENLGEIIPVKGIEELRRMRNE